MQLITIINLQQRQNQRLIGKLSMAKFVISNHKKS
jgi:hypothetical protein